MANVFFNEEAKEKLAADWRERAKLFLKTGVSADAETDTKKPKQKPESYFSGLKLILDCSLTKESQIMCSLVLSYKSVCR